MTGEPYTPQLIIKLLRAKSDEALCQVTPDAFNAWPTRRIVPAAQVRTLIENEKARRAR
jgi:hypothetical protein